MNKKQIIIVIFMFLALITILKNREKFAEKLPSDLNYPKFSWEPPLGSPYRTTLENGLKLYIAEDRKVPIISISGYIKCGSIMDPVSKEGLGNLALRVIRTGGTEKYPADILDELIDRYAISFSFSLSSTMLKFSSSFLTNKSDTALDIIEQLLFYPKFSQKRVDEEKGLTINALSHRFDNPEPVLSTAWTKSMYPNMRNSRLTTKKSIQNISRNDMINFHKAYFRTENMLLAVSGDFNKDSISTKLEKIFPTADTTNIIELNFSDIHSKPKQKILIVQKKISQAYVRIGSPLFKRPTPAYYPLTLFNNVLGGGGFTSKLASTVRSDRGLTYSIYSSIGSNYFYPALFKIGFFTKSSTVNEAIGITLRETKKLLKEGLNDVELENAKKVLLGSLPSMFRSKDNIVDTYAWNEYHNRSEDHFRIYDDKLNAITKTEIDSVANIYLNIDSLAIVIVGDTAQLFRSEKSDGFSLLEQKNIKIISEKDLLKGF